MIKKTRYPLPHTENKLTRQIHNNLTKHHYIKEISKWTYHIKKPQEDEMYLFQTNGTEMELERTIQYIQLDPYGIHTYVTFTRKSNSKQYKLQQDTTIFTTPFDIKLVNKQELLEQQLQTSPPPRHGKTWLTEQLKRINEKLKRK